MRVATHKYSSFLPLYEKETPMNGSTGGGSLSQDGKSKLNVRSLRCGGAEGACE